MKNGFYYNLGPKYEKRYYQEYDNSFSKSSLNELIAHVANCSSHFKYASKLYNYFNGSASLVDDVDKSCMMLDHYIEQCRYMLLEMRRTLDPFEGSIYSKGAFGGDRYATIHSMLTHLENNTVYTSYLVYVPLVEYLQQLKDEQHAIWLWDIDDYCEENNGVIVEIFEHIASLLPHSLLKEDIPMIVNCLMMSIFGCLPIIDYYFKHALMVLAIENEWSLQLKKEFTVDLLQTVSHYYALHQKIVDEIVETGIKSQIITFKKRKDGRPLKKAQIYYFVMLKVFEISRHNENDHQHVDRWFTI